VFQVQRIKKKKKKIEKMYFLFPSVLLGFKAWYEQMNILQLLRIMN